MFRLNFAQFGLLDAALLDGERASRVKSATRRRGGRRGQLGNGDGGGSLPVAFYSSTGRFTRKNRPRQNGHGLDEVLRIGMKRAGYNFLSRPHLDEFPQIHHSDSRCHVPQDRNAVRSKQVGHAELLLQVEEEIEDLRLHGNVERRHRLIGHHESRFQGQCPRHGNPLALPAAELVRVAAQRIAGQATASNNAAVVRASAYSLAASATNPA